MNSFIIRYSSLGRPPHWYSYVPKSKKSIQLSAYYPFSQLEVWQEHKDRCALRFVVQWKEPKVFHELELPDKLIKAFSKQLAAKEQELIHKIMNLDSDPDIVEETNEPT